MFQDFTPPITALVGQGRKKPLLSPWGWPRGRDGVQEGSTKERREGRKLVREGAGQRIRGLKLSQLLLSTVQDCCHPSGPAADLSAWFQSLWDCTAEN